MHKIDRALQFFSTRISPQAFVRLALVISGVLLLAVLPVFHGLYKEKLPKVMQLNGTDFAQYYEGALAVRHGLWNHLYPKPKLEVYSNPPEFKPIFSTKLFDPNAPESRQGHWAFYGTVAVPSNSAVDPEVLALCPELEGATHFMYPPPLGVLLWPLGFFDHYAAASAAWFAFLCASFFGTAYFSSRICRILFQKATYLEGWVVLLPLIPICLGSDLSVSLHTGNVSAFLGFLITGVTYAWIRNRQVLMGFGIIPLVLFKGIGLSWCPLLLLRPIKWKTLGVLAALTLLLNGVTLHYGGIEIYRTFLTDMLPKANIPYGLSLQMILLTLFGVELKPLFLLLNFSLIGIIYLGYWRQTQGTDPAQHPSAIVATVAGTMAVFCLCNGVSLPNHYYINYLALPFAGWILWEGLQAGGLWKKAIFTMFALSFLFCLDALILMKNSWLMDWLKQEGLYNRPIELTRTAISSLVVYLLTNLEFAFLLALAYRRLFFCKTPVEKEQILAPTAK